MANLTAQQVKDLADNLAAMAQVIDDYRMKNSKNLLDSQNQQIKDLADTIRDNADRLYSLSATVVIDDIQKFLDAIEKVTNDMKITFETLENIQKAINVAAAVAALASSILSGKPQSIAQSINDFANSL